jgi:Fe2+/Zn2+ uptake regulation proteins
MNRTKLKIDILLKLSISSRPLSINDLHQALDFKCDISTIFRTISQFKDKNLVSEINLEEGFYRYELSLQKKTLSHHHHIRCRVCGEIRNLESCDLSSFEKSIKKLGFTQMEHRLEFSGLCSRCSKS